MNGIFGAIAALMLMLSGCTQQPDNTSSIQKIAFQWEKASINLDYKTQQKLLYQPGTYEVNKTAQKQNSGLKETDIQYQIYFDNQNSWYDVVTTYDNPFYGNKVQDKLVIRQKGKDWKVDKRNSTDLLDESLTQIQNETQQIACINCKK